MSTSITTIEITDEEDQDVVTVQIPRPDVPVTPHAIQVAGRIARRIMHDAPGVGPRGAAALAAALTGLDALDAGVTDSVAWQAGHGRPERRVGGAA